MPPFFYPLFYIAIFVFWWRDKEMKAFHFYAIIVLSIVITLPPSINPFYLIYDLITHTQRFHGVACTKDCSGHKAGYAWAEANSDADLDECESNSKSFTEGCQIYYYESAGPAD